MNSKKWRDFFYNLEKEEPNFNPNLSLIDESIFDSMDLVNLSEAQIKLLMEGRKENVIQKYRDSIEEESLETIIE